MNKVTFYAIIITLVSLIPFSFIGIVGSMVSKKYEVDEMYHNPYNRPLSQQEIEENKAVAQRDFELNVHIWGYITLAILSIAGIVILFWRRLKSVMKE